MHRVVFFLLVLLCAVPIPVTALDFNAYWLYRTSGGEERDTSDEFQERYTLGVGPQLSWQPTHALSATATVGYTRTQRDSGDGMVKVDEITPSVNFGIINDLFSAQLAGSASQYSGSDVDTSASHSWDTTLSSRWQRAWWPNLRFNYGERDSGESSSELFSRTEQIQKYASADLDWDLRLLKLDYRYNTSWDEDVSEGNDSERRSHFVRAATGGRFWDDRISYTLSHQFEDDRTQVKGSLGSGGFFDFFVPATVTAKAVTESEDPEDPNYVDPDDDSNPPQEVLREEYLHIEIAAESGRQIDSLRLFFESSANLEVASLLEWNLYRKDLFSSVWQEVDTGIQSVLRDGYLELTMDTAEETFLLVAQTSPLQPIRLTGVEAYIQSGSDTVTNQRHLTSAGVQVRLTNTLNLAVNSILERLRRDDASDDDRSTLSTRLRWTPRPWITPSISFSESTLDGERVDGFDDQLNRTYSLNVATLPLPTMNLSFGVSRSERSGEFNTVNAQNGDKTIGKGSGESMSYNISTTARLYPDLNTSLFLSWRNNQSRSNSQSTTRRLQQEMDENGDPKALIITDTFTDTRSSGKDESFVSRFNLNARLSRTLSTDLTASYRRSSRSSIAYTVIDEEIKTITAEGSTFESSSEPKSAPSSTKSHVADATLSVQYRPSSLLALRAFYTAYLLDSDQEDVVGGSANLALLRTDKARLNFSYDVTDAETLTNRFSLNGSWDISRALALQSRGGYTLAETDFYDVQVSLNLRL